MTDVRVALSNRTLADRSPKVIGYFCHPWITTFAFAILQTGVEPAIYSFQHYCLTIRLLLVFMLEDERDHVASWNFIPQNTTRLLPFTRTATQRLVKTTAFDSNLSNCRPTLVLPDSDRATTLCQFSLCVWRRLFYRRYSMANNTTQQVAPVMHWYFSFPHSAQCAINVAHSHQLGLHGCLLAERYKRILVPFHTVTSAYL